MLCPLFLFTIARGPTRRTIVAFPLKTTFTHTAPKTRRQKIILNGKAYSLFNVPLLSSASIPNSIRDFLRRFLDARVIIPPAQRISLPCAIAHDLSRRPFALCPRASAPERTGDGSCSGNSCHRARSKRAKQEPSSHRFGSTPCS